MTEHAPSPPQNLWDFAVAFYGAEGVADACLALQDRHGLDVNILMLAMWAGHARHMALDSGDLEPLLAQVAPWTSKVVQPLRALRRTMKSSPLADFPGAPELRQRVKELELEAEKLELACLERLVMPQATESHPQEPNPDLAWRNLELVLDALASPAVPPDATERRTLHAALQAFTPAARPPSTASPGTRGSRG